MIQNDLTQQSQAEIELAYLYQLKDTLEILQKNLQLLADGDQGTRITVSGTNLFALASEYYGDPTYWNVIAQANQSVIKDVNGLIDPNLTGVVTLVIPPKPAQSNGGIFNA